MFLFSKEKELIFKITNAVLLLWFVGAVIFTLVSIVNHVLKEPELSYEEHKVISCGWYKDLEDLDDTEQEKRCQDDYKTNAVWRKTSNHDRMLVIYGGMINVFVVGGILGLMNKKEGKKK